MVPGFLIRETKRRDGLRLFELRKIAIVLSRRQVIRNARFTRAWADAQQERATSLHQKPSQQARLRRTSFFPQNSGPADQ
jgi:hypothetical protein